jgi:hypothetical protein
MKHLPEDRLAAAINAALGTPATSDQWAAADAALDAVIDNSACVRRLSAIGISFDDLVSNQWVEILSALNARCQVSPNQL